MIENLELLIDNSDGPISKQKVIFSDEKCTVSRGWTRE